MEAKIKVVRKRLDKTKPKTKSKRGGKRPGAGRPKGSRDGVPPDDRARFQVHCRTRSERIFTHIDRLLADEKLDANTFLQVARFVVEYGFGRPGTIEPTDEGEGTAALLRLLKLMAGVLNEKEVKILDAAVGKLIGSEGSANSRALPAPDGGREFAATAGYLGKGEVAPEL